ncbi:helix-turn-helix domain-containing protein [Kushneria indalinina]|uniref:helix-turn-helix domain-containing protein n=1 Tax=Kushneria indalinina TaxID=184067 RepID=UPI00147651B9
MDARSKDKTEQFRLLRRISGKTQREMAEHLGVSHATIRSWEASANPVQESALRNLKAYLVLAGKVDVIIPREAISAQDKDS